MIMRLELICSGLTKLLVDNNYSPTTINFYKREWKKLNDFLLLEYGDDDFSIDKGLIFLEKIHGIVSSFEESKLKDQQLQLIRSIQILQDYKLHGVITKRYYAYDNNLNIFNVNSQFLFENVSIYIMPMVNPDGVDLVTGNLPRSSSAFIRVQSIAKNFSNIS